jgi:YVTN family beta-propeller protein
MIHLGIIRQCRPVALAILASVACIAVPAAHAQAVTATVVAGPNPFAIAVNSVTNKIYVVNRNTSGSVTVIDGATNATSTIAVGSNPNAVAVNMVTNKVYVTNNADETLSVIDGATGAVVSTIHTGTNPISIALNTKLNRIYVLNDAVDGPVTAIDGNTNTVADQIFTGSDTSSIAVDPSADTLYAIGFTNNNYPMVTTPTLYSVVGLPVGTITNGTDSVLEVLESRYPYSVAVNPQNGQVFVAALKDACIYVINFSNGVRTAVQKLGNGGFLQIIVNSATGVAYSTNGAPYGFESVTAVNGNTYAVSNLPAGPNPLGLAADEATNVLYVANGVSPGTVTAIDCQTNLPTIIPVGTNPFLVAVNPVTDKVYAINNDANGTISVINGIPATAAPLIQSQPQPQVINAGSTVVFNASASGRPAATYQWTFNGAPLSDGPGVLGSTAATLVISGASAANAGAYACIASNASGHAASTPASLGVVSSPTPGRIVNLSTRARVESGIGVDGSQVLIAGFSIKGPSSMSVILRGVGPALADFGVPGAIELPSLALYDTATPANVITQDTGWQSPPVPPAGAPWKGSVTPIDATLADFSAVGAFALPPGSADSAVKLSLPAGTYTTQVSATDSSTGIVLAEVYDADPGTGADEFANISSRAFVGDGASAMIAGFVISGSTAETVLIRVSGPALVPLGVTSTLLYPNVLVYDGSGNLIASNANWGGSPEVAAAAARVGAFPWSDPTSSDSAVLLTLPPGSYTAEVNPTAFPYGNALIEVYAVP